ncbi:MAG: hypothetical protein JWL96_924 [Sphingomonas bacterium]|uniref:DUF1254 domain-containing protein n=1 Tax=Sphingomonas bacterium TaxID=1895847 RepID=UPI00260411EC|nr:DUF1254 domain-containing protein [Sphingomonas bacterium]MDB5708854.1 hypothetical protein [Sphingomonas bacterium]
MIRRWGAPLLLGLVLAGLAYHLTLVQTPRLLMRFATHRIAGAAGYNALYQAPLATSDSRAIVRPSPDLAYSSCPFDLTKGPVLIDVAPVPAPYWSLSVFDPRTDVAFVRNNIQAGGKPIRVALIGERGGQAPPGYAPVLVNGNSGIALVRTLVDDRARFPQIEAARRTSRCGSMSPS